jgi:IclR family transcriptional regulator, acetate operon repressor
MAEAPSYPIASVDSALRLLLMFRDQPHLRVAEAASRLGVARSTAHRLLAMLVAHDFVSRDPDTKVYSAGTALLTLGLAAVRNYDLRTQMRPHLEQLTDEVNETTHLIVRNHAESFFLDSCESGQAVRTGSRVGISFPAYTNSGGKALLAELSTEELRILYPEKTLPPMSPSTLRTRSALEAELDEIRERGYALNLGETDEEVGAIATVVRDLPGGPPCAVAIAAPLSRTSREKLISMSGALIATCERAGQAGGAITGIE